jgi:hypothetical protein
MSTCDELEDNLIKLLLLSVDGVSRDQIKQIFEALEDADFIICQEDPDFGGCAGYRELYSGDLLVDPFLIKIKEAP